MRFRDMPERVLDQGELRLQLPNSVARVKWFVRNR
jgi:hypothetical protein